MEKNRSLYSIAFILLLFSSACKKDDASAGDVVYTSGDITMDFTNVVGTDNLDATGGTTYMNAADEEFTVTMFKYYVSNFELIKEDGSTYSVPETYFLIDESKPSTFNPVLSNIPGGVYTGVKYTIGVDSTHNVSGAQAGDLDPANGMIWSWNTGYIFVKMEGTCNSAPGGTFQYHVSGYSDYPPINGSAIRYVTMNFNGDKLIVNGAREAEIHVMVDVLEFFQNPDNLSITTTNKVVTAGLNATTMATRYQDMFKYDHIHNAE